jgi:hypothetical protein
MTSRAEELRAELAEIERKEAEQAEQQRQQEQVERRERKLTPDQQAEAADLLERANEALERQYPAAWLPHKNQEQPRQIVGKVLRINPRVGPSPVYGTYSAAIEVLTTEHDEWTVWANEGGALYSQLVRQRIQPGDVIGVRYRGKKQSTTSAFEYQDYRLIRLDDEEQSSWVDYDQLAREREQPQLPPAAGETETEDDIPF